MASVSAIPGWAGAVGRIPGGLFVVTLKTAAIETGMLASWVQQCSFEPPQLSIAVQSDRPLLQGLEAGAMIGVNVIPEGGKSLIAHFGKGFAPGEAAFEGQAVERSESHAPRLSAAAAWIDTRLVAKQPAGDHTLLIVTVIDGAIQEGHSTVHLRKDARRY